MVIQHEMAFEPGLGRCRRCLADMVGLKAALRNDDSRACRQRCADQELSLAGLVAAESKPDAIVALDVESGPADMLVQPGKRFQRRREMREDELGEMGERHEVPPSRAIVTTLAVRNSETSHRN